MQVSQYSRRVVVAVMGLPGPTFYFKIDKVLLQLSGVPISSRERLTKKQIIFSTVCITSHVSVVFLMVHQLFSSEGKSGKLIRTFSGLPWAIFDISKIIVIFNMVYQRRKITVLFQKVEILQKALEANVFERNQSELSCFIRIFITALQAAGFLFHLIHGSFGNVILFERVGLPQCVAIAISLVISTTAIPSISLFTFIINGYITGSLFTFENKELIVQRMCFRHKRDNVIEVLPGVETVATYSSSGVNLEFGREEFVWPIGSYLEMLQIHSEAKSIHLIHNSWYHIPLTWLTFNFSLFVPTMVASSFLFQTQALTYIWRVGISLTMLSIVVEVAVCIFISDIFIRDRSLRGVAKVQKEVFTSADQQKKKILSRFVCSSKDEYLESPYWLFESCSSILPFLIDTAVLVATTFLVP
ncbi:hypothetical protein J6590_083464 [Homalodisca vitripennis]|nr:hypothetical protein J6590_083464 [Homalodisca vitripennis]